MSGTEAAGFNHSQPTGPSSHPKTQQSPTWERQPAGFFNLSRPLGLLGGWSVLFPPSPLWFSQMPSTVAEAFKRGNPRTLHGVTPLWPHAWDRKPNEPENPASLIQTIRPLLPRPHTPPQKAHNLAFSKFLPRQLSSQQLALTGPSLDAWHLPNTAMWGVLWAGALSPHSK